jgi:uroporphyrinogen-III synthase
VKLLVTGPAAQAGKTAARLRECGHEALVSPLLRSCALAWNAPAGAFEAVIATSANAFTQPLAPFLAALPCYCVGAATADAARAAGAQDLRIAEGRGAEALYAAVAAAGVCSALHLAGEAVTDAPVPATLRLRRVTTYRMELLPLGHEAAAALERQEIDWTLLYSARTAAQFLRELGRLGIERSAQKVALLGTPPADFPRDWRRCVAAEMPNERALFAAAGVLCE